RLALRYAFFGGETLTRGDVASLRALAPAATCVNYYGATETPQAMGHFVVGPGDSDTPLGLSESIPLGRGIADVQLLVLNAEGRLAGIGERGEIHVRTPYLAQGYLAGTGSEASRFLADAPGGGSPVRVYRTGDLGRYRLDGAVEFAGRNDDQV